MQPVGTSAARLTVLSSGSTIPLTSLSVTWESFESRALVPRWSASNAQPGCPTSTDSTTVECPNDHASTSHGRLSTMNLILVGSSPQRFRLDRESFLRGSGVGGPYLNGVWRSHRGETKYPRSWRVLVKEGSDSPAPWTTWIDARDNWPSGMRKVSRRVFRLSKR